MDGVSEFSSGKNYTNINDFSDRFNSEESSDGVFLDFNVLDQVFKRFGFFH